MHSIDYHPLCFEQHAVWIVVFSVEQTLLHEICHLTETISFLSRAHKNILFTSINTECIDEHSNIMYRETNKKAFLYCCCCYNVTFALMVPALSSHKTLIENENTMSWNAPSESKVQGKQNKMKHMQSHSDCKYSIVFFSCFCLSKLSYVFCIEELCSLSMWARIWLSIATSLWSKQKYNYALVITVLAHSEIHCRPLVLVQWHAPAVLTLCSTTSDLVPASTSDGWHRKCGPFYTKAQSF